MTVNEHNVTDWQTQNAANIAKHRSQPLKPHNEGGLFGRDMFGFATQTLGISPNGPLGALVNSNFDMDTLLSQGKTWATSWLGQAVNRYLSDGGNKGRLHDKYLGFKNRYDGTTDWHEPSFEMDSVAQDREYQKVDFESRNDKPGPADMLREMLGSLESKLVYGKAEGFRFNHKLENKGHLSFSYDKNAYGADILMPINTTLSPGVIRHGDTELPVFKLPFLETPKISETRQATYASHDIVNRNEPYRLWTGAKAKKLSVSFNITGPHLVTFAQTLMAEQVEGALMSQEFKTYLSDLIKDQNSMDWSPDQAAEQNISSANNDMYDTTHKMLTDDTATGSINSGDAPYGKPRRNLIMYTMFLLNLIRSSVIGSTNASTPEEGKFRKSYIPAPVIFLTYGAMYDREPFIATNYSITFDGKRGYEELSMLPRVISIKLSLEGFNQFENSDTTRGLSRLFTPKS